MQKNEVEPISHTLHKKQFKWIIIDLHVDLSNENKSIHTCDLGLDNGILGITSKAHTCVRAHACTHAKEGKVEENDS